MAELQFQLKVAILGLSCHVLRLLVCLLID